MSDDFYTPTDDDMLRMENDLLAFEAGFLRARIMAVDAGPSANCARLASMSRLRRQTNIAVPFVPSRSTNAPQPTKKVRALR